MKTDIITVIKPKEVKEFNKLGTLELPFTEECTFTNQFSFNVIGQESKKFD